MAQDYKLRFALRGTEFWGGYLTDIIKDFPEKACGNVVAYLRKHPDVERLNAEIFSQELDAM